MDYEFRTLDLNYERLSEYCVELRKKIVETANENQEGEGYDLPFTKYRFMWAERNSELAIGAYKNDELVGTIMTIVKNIIFNDPDKGIKGLKLKAGFLCNLGVAAELWPGMELKKELLNKLLEKLKEQKIDFLIINPLQDKDSDFINYMKSIGFSEINKNVEASVKMMGKDAVDQLKIAEGLNPIEVGAAKLLAGWKSDGITEGVIRDVTERDYSKIVDLLNDYANELQIAVEWKIEDLEEFIKIIKNLDHHRIENVKDKFPKSSYGAHLKVWEINGDIKAHVFFALIEVHLQHAHLPLILWENSSFSKDLSLDQKKDFISQILKEHENKAIVCNLMIPYLDKKAFDKAGFMGDRRNRKLLVKALTKEAKSVEASKKVKNFYINSFNFTI
ncbi:MAG: hypothetical protein EAX96_17935 [Candidatus Lokiarchaeota archaeon]|nr:hypothetical protein [Candidatus Lokiarchaeota archaeon]